MPVILPSLSPHSGSTEQNGQSMKRTLEGMAKAGEPLLREALDAIRAHQAAQYMRNRLETLCAFQELARTTRMPGAAVVSLNSRL